MISSELICFWTAIVLLAASFFMAIASVVFKRQRLFEFARALALVAFICVTVLGVVRWTRTGHPPFVSKFESMLTSVWFVLLIFHVLALRVRQSHILLLPIAGVTFLLLGWASSLSPDASPLTAALTNVWLFVHASFATLGAASFVVASAFSGIYLLGEGYLDRVKHTVSKVPEYRSLHKSILNFLTLGLILWGIMIVSGSIWAHVAWGRYWAWDPIELWSLIGWMMFALLLHTRLTFKITHRVFSWMTIGASLVVLFALWGVQYVYNTIHTYG